MERSLGYPGYDSVMPKSCGTVAEVLQARMVTIPRGSARTTTCRAWQSSAAGPFDLWPTGLGFEYFYGFIGGDVQPVGSDGVREHVAPSNRRKRLGGQSESRLTTSMPTWRITRSRWIQDQQALAPDKPFFAYYVPGATHAPHHAPKEWIAKFKGQFDQGWDKVREETFARQKAARRRSPPNALLTPRPANLPAWDSLDAKQKGLYRPDDGNLRRVPGLHRP